MCYSSGYYITICLCWTHFKKCFFIPRILIILTLKVGKHACRQYREQCNYAWIIAVNHSKPQMTPINCWYIYAYMRGNRSHSIVIIPLFPSCGAAVAQFVGTSTENRRVAGSRSAWTAICTDWWLERCPFTPWALPGCSWARHQTPTPLLPGDFKLQPSHSVTFPFQHVYRSCVWHVR